MLRGSFLPHVDRGNELGDEARGWEQSYIILQFISLSIGTDEKVSRPRSCSPVDGSNLGDHCPTGVITTLLLVLAGVVALAAIIVGIGMYNYITPQDVN